MGKVGSISLARFATPHPSSLPKRVMSITSAWYLPLEPSSRVTASSPTRITGESPNELTLLGPQRQPYYLQIGDWLQGQTYKSVPSGLLATRFRAALARGQARPGSRRHRRSQRSWKWPEAHGHQERTETHAPRADVEPCVTGE